MSNEPVGQELTSDELEIGLQVDRLRTPDIIAFIQGLPRRVRERLVTLDDDSGENSGEESGENNAIKDIIDDIAVRLDTLIQELIKTGYAPDTSLAVPSHSVGTDLPTMRGPLARVDAGATEAAQRLAGLPTPAWTSHPDLSDVARTTVAEATRCLRLLPNEPSADSGADEHL